MRSWAYTRLSKLIAKHSITGSALEIGGRNAKASAEEIIKKKGLKYNCLGLTKDGYSNYIGDICSNNSEILNSSFDLVLSSDVFEHLRYPWLAAEEIYRILKPGGISATFTVWSWRYHPCPIDHWRYSHKCLEDLFSRLTTLESGFDCSSRRTDIRGIREDGSDSVVIDKMGGWRENWNVYHVGQKDA